MSTRAARRGAAAQGPRQRVSKGDTRKTPTSAGRVGKRKGRRHSATDHERAGRTGGDERDKGRRPRDEVNEWEGGAESVQDSTNRHPASHHHD